MTVSIGQFVEQLAASGLMTAVEIESFQAGLPPEKSPHDAQALARELILAGKLTKYQAQCVYQRKTKGLVLGEYVVLDKIGEGGMGQVLKARHRTMERIVALKILPPKSVDSPEAIKRFRREVQAAARLTHPNIVMAYDAGEHAGIHFLAMEYVEGKDLASVIKERGPLELASALDCTLQAARGLAYAHAEGVIHRDIKPGNLLLDKKGTVKILDMGLARVDVAAGTHEPGAERLTQSGQVMGTCDYMAPEQAYDTHTADHRSDIYSLGCTLHRLLTGNPPYSRDTLMQILLAHREARIPSLRDARPDVHERVDGVFQKMVAKEPEQRQQSMAEVVAELEECLRPVARPAIVVSVPEESRSAAASDSLLQNLSFLQESVPPPLPGRRGRTASRDDTPRPAAYDQTGASIATRIKRAMAASGPKPLALLAVAGASALVVVVAALVLTLTNRGPAPDASLSPGDGQRESKPAAAVATKGPQPGPLAKAKGPAPPLAIAPFDATTARKHQKAWADYLGVSVEFTNSIGMKFVLIPPGEFDMGCTQMEVGELVKEAKEKNYDPWYIERLPAEAPRHRVRLTKPFYLGTCEVTVGAFRRFVDDTGYKSDAEKDGKGGYGSDEKGVRTQKPEFDWRNPGFAQSDAHPVVNVSWNDAAAFCEWLSRKESKEYRLATEAEWEYTCRAGSTTRYSFGDDEAALGDYAWCGGNSGDKTHPVGEKKPNAWGLYDILGNVWEWCADGYDAKYYERSPNDDPPGPTPESSRVLRGGSWLNGPNYARSGYREGYSPDYRSYLTGFRVARTVLPSAAKSDEAGEFPGLPEFPDTPIAVTPAPAAPSPDGWGEPVNLGPTVNTNANEAEPCLSADGLILLFNSDRPGGQGLDLWICTRASCDERFSEPANLGAPVNSSALDIQPGLSVDGLTLLFSSDRPGGQGDYDLWMCSRASRDESFSPPVNLGPVVNSAHIEQTPKLSADGLTLYFSSWRPRPQGGGFCWTSQRASRNGPFGPPVNLGLSANMSAIEGAPAFSADGLRAYFCANRPGGQGDWDLWFCTRAGLDKAFGQPVNLGTAVNSSSPDGGPTLSADGLTLLFHSSRPGGRGGDDLWMSTRPPQGGTGSSSQGERPGPLPKEKQSAPPPAERSPTPSSQVSPKPGEERKKRPVPSAEIQRELGDNIEKVYNLAEALTPEAKIQLAKRLVEQSKKTADPNEQFMLLRKAADLACDGGDAALTLEMLEPMTVAFAIDPLNAKAAMLERFAKGPRNPERLKALADSSAGVIDDAVADDRFELALSLAKTVMDACARSTSPPGKELRKEAADRRKRVQQLQTRFQEVEKATEALKADPENAAANLAVGAWHCLVKDDWQTGLPHLAKGSDAVLKGLAERELSSPPASPEDQVNLADAWWDAGSDRRGDERAPMLRRAGHWYEQAFGKLQGVNKTKAEQRRAEIATLGDGPALPSGRPPPLAIAPFDARRAQWFQLQWARYLKVPVEFTNSVGMKFVLIPPGEFDMGSTQEEINRLLNQAKQRNFAQWYVDTLPSEAPRHRVRLTRAFYLGQYEVTQAQYRQVAGSNPSESKESGPDAPAEWVTWNDAVAFCQRLSALPAEKGSRGAYRLPTEAEWEFAARAGTTTAWCFGDAEAALSEYAWWPGNSGGQTHPVGQKRPNGSLIFDVHGNAWEWCADWFATDYYTKSPSLDPVGPDSGASRVLRGGSFYDRYPGLFRCAFRLAHPDYRPGNPGFRVARTLTP